METLAEFRSKLTSEGASTRTAGGVEYFGTTALYEIKKSLTPAIKAIKAAGGSVENVKHLDDGTLVTVRDRDGKTYNLFVKKEIEKRAAKSLLLNLEASIQSNSGKPLGANYIPVALPKAIETPITTKTPDAPEEPARNPGAPPLPTRKPSGAPMNTPRSDAGMETPSDSLDLNLPDYGAGLDTTGTKTPASPDGGSAAENEPSSILNKVESGATTVGTVAIGTSILGGLLKKLGAKALGTALSKSSKAMFSLSGNLLTTTNPVFAAIKHIVFRPLQMAWYGTIHVGRSLFSPAAKQAKVRNLVKLRQVKDIFVLKSTRDSIRKNGFLKATANGLVNGIKGLWGDTKAIFTPLVQYAKTSLAPVAKFAQPLIAKITKKTVTKPGFVIGAIALVTNAAQKIGAGKLAGILSKIAPKVGTIGRVAVARAAIPAMVIDLASKPIGNLVTQLSGNKVAGSTTAGTLSGLGTGLGIVAAVAMFTPVGWFAAAAVAIGCAAYSGYRAYKNAKAEEKTPPYPKPSAAATM